MAKTKSISLESPVSVTFTVKMETDKAIIAENIQLNGQDYISSTNLPKMYTVIHNTDDNGVTSADVESWVLKQRAEELYNPNKRDVAKELLAVRYSQDEVEAMPWD